MHHLPFLKIGTCTYYVSACVFDANFVFNHFPYYIVLSVILKSKIPDDLVKMPSMQNTIEALIPYTGTTTNLNCAPASCILMLN